MGWPAVAWFVAKIIISLAIAYLLAPKNKFEDPRAAGLDQFQFPTAEVGREFGVLFGAKAIKSQNVVWYGDLGTEEIEEKMKSGMFSSTKITLGYKYYLGVHMILCHDVDRITKVTINQDVLWSGSTYGTANIDRPNFWGGEKEKGGIKGTMTLLPGTPDQQPHPYLESKLPGPVPAFRGVASILLTGSSYKAIRVIDTDGANIWLTDTGVSSGAPYETWTLTCIGGEKDAEQFSVVGSESGDQGTVTLGSHYNNGIVEFTVVNLMIYLFFRDESLTGIPEGATLTFSITKRYYNGQSGMYLGVSEYIEPWVIWSEKIYDDWYPAKAAIGSDGDMNPAHIVRKVLTSNKFGMGYNDADVDDDAFAAAADTLYSEGFGLSFLWDYASTVQDFLGEVLKHIDASLYTDIHTGRFVLKLIRDDYDINALPVFDESNVTAVPVFRRRTLEDISNQVTVKYWDRTTGNTGSVTRADIAMVARSGGTNATTLEFPGIANRQLAERVLSRELRSLSTPMASATVLTNRDGADLSPGQPFILSWPQYGVQETVMRVVAVEYGEFGDSSIRIECVEDIFAVDDATYTAPPPSGWVSPISDPVPCPVHVAMETPYYKVARKLGQTEAAALADNVGYASLVGTRPSQDATALDIHFKDPGDDYALEQTKRFAPYGYLARDIYITSGSLPVSWERGGEFIELGMWAAIGDEIVRIDGMDETILTVGRGCLDTVPRAHAADTPVVVLSEFLATKESKNQDGETVYGKALPRTAKGTLALVDAPEQNIIMDSRMIRPYPPARLRINTEADPREVIGDLSLEWRHRDRTQQLEDEIADTGEDVHIGPETGTTYALEVRRADNDLLLYSASGLSGSTVTVAGGDIGYDGDVELMVWAERDGFASWQRQKRAFVYLQQEPRMTESGEYRLTESDEYRIVEG